MMTVKKRNKKAILSKKHCLIAYDVNAKCFPPLVADFHRTLTVGTLVVVEKLAEDPYVVVKVASLEGQYSHVEEEDLWLCHKDALIPVEKSLWPLLTAVPSPVERVYILREKGLIEELASIEVGSLVVVIGVNERQASTAVVKFKGPIINKGPGIYFGVEILDGDCEGESDGSFGNQRFFTCPQGTGLIIPVNRLRLARSQFLSSSPPRTSVQSLTDKFERMHRSYASDVSHLIKSSSKCECEKSNLKVGDRVVWISDDGPTDGVVVRRLGCHDNDQLRVSVQFDEPLKGDLASSSDSSRLSVLPAVELVKASDFYGSQGKENGHIGVQWSNGGLEKNKEVGARLSKSSQDLISLYTPPPSNSEDALSTGSEGSGYYDTPESTGDESLGVGSLVEVSVKGEPLYGVIRWVGSIPGDKRPRKIAGIEMEEEHPGFGDGTFNKVRYFYCNPERGFFVNLNQCRKDSRFQDIPNVVPPTAATSQSTKQEDFGCIESPSIEGFVRPREGDISSMCGKYRGIQGHHNSCYLDATLFSMFTFTSVFDSLLYRPAGPSDIPHYEEVQRVLREDIVNPLRENLYVRADRVMKLRTLMEKLSSVSGLTTEEKDPEEFLTSLVAQILKAEPFLKLNSGQEAYHYQLFVEKDEALSFPTVQQLFEQSILTSDIKLKEVPACLIIQMPRFGKSYKMYPRILPSQLLDVTDVIENSPRQCTVCGKLAEFECKQCFDQCDVGLQSISFCSQCLETVHNHEKRRSHSWRRLSVPVEFTALKDHCVIPRLYMQLFAVVCIETSHYVTFVKCGTGSEAPWCFFDSMADRKGEQNGYNIPEVLSCPNLPYWLSEKGSQMLSQIKDERQLPEHAKRLLCDAYMCMYQSTEVMMYR